MNICVIFFKKIEKKIRLRKGPHISNNLSSAFRYTD